ncbi:MAG: bifunctional homocysteine S-methyltransferase/methylenetetrahydrofolate reductase [Acidobacteriota bacterium]|nr:bifunctional homocysteine S-methyltransferase/methylenetetrahydrofolate reductase [Acidobacteriota bacterium]
MGTMLYARGIFINRCYDELNLSAPDTIAAVHTEYLQAGAEIIETNTFGANSFRMERFGLRDKVAEINRAGIRIARQCCAQMSDKQASEAFVAGAIGPLGVRLEPLGKIGLDEAHAAFAEQIAALAEGGPGVGADLLIVETMTSLAEASQAVLAAQKVAPSLRILVMMTVDEDGNCLDGTSAEAAAATLTELGADAVGCNCSAGPATVLSVIERMRSVTHLPLAAMPNAGMPREVEGRNIYMASPEYIAGFTRKFLHAGASFLGGCCGTTPAHIRAMRSAVRALEAQESSDQPANTGTAQADPEAAVDFAPLHRPKPLASKVAPPPLAERSHIGGMIARSEFVTLVEIVPPKGIDCSKEIEGARLLHSLGVHAINVPDSPRASARMSAQSLCVQIQQGVGIETVLHYTCRDRNVLSIQSDLIGASSIGLKNILCLTGDPPKLGNYPDATAVFDVDAIGLTNLVRKLNHGLDLGDNPIGASTGFTVSVAANPGVPDIDHEVRRFAYKVEAGAEYAITQPVFDMRLLEAFLKRIEQFRIPVIAGIWPLTSLRNAEFMKTDLRVSMPDEILARMNTASVTPETARAEGVRIAQEMLAEARPMVQGVQVSAPFGKYTAAAQVLGLA